MKYALIGCGRIALNHIKAANNNGLELVAVCDIESRNIDVLFEKQLPNNITGITRYIDYKQMIQGHTDLELVAIATPSGCHAEIAIYCIEHGVNVIIEKPMAMNMADAKKIIEVSQKKRVVVSVCHQNRFNLAVQQLKKAVEYKRFGKISHGSIHVRWNRNEDYYKQATWRGTWMNDGGCLMNQCIHGIDLLRWLMGDDVDTVYGITRQQQHHYLETEDVGMALVSFKDGSIATIEGSVNVYPRNLEETLYLFGEKGTVKLGGTSANNIDIWDFLDSSSSDKNIQGFHEETCNVYGNGHTTLYADVIDSIINHHKPYVDAVAGKNALEMILAIYKSMKTGLPVKFPLEDFSSLDMKGTF